jgi:hypothetical protein
MNVTQVHVMSLLPVQINQEPTSVPVMLDFLEMGSIALVCHEISLFKPHDNLQIAWV